MCNKEAVQDLHLEKLGCENVMGMNVEQGGVRQLERIDRHRAK